MWHFNHNYKCFDCVGCHIIMIYTWTSKYNMARESYLFKKQHKMQQIILELNNMFCIYPSPVSLLYNNKPVGGQICPHPHFPPINWPRWTIFPIFFGTPLDLKIEGVVRNIDLNIQMPSSVLRVLGPLNLLYLRVLGS